MVWAFVAGICAGLPAGCYLREHGYADKLRNAYGALQPGRDDMRTDNLEKLMPTQKRNQFYQDLQRGLAKPEDFERYVYGGNYDSKFGHDDRDAIEDKVRDQIRDWNMEAKDQIEAIKRQE